MTENAERLSELDLPSDLGRHGRSVLLQSTPDSIKIATQSTHRAATEHA